LVECNVLLIEIDLDSKHCATLCLPHYDLPIIYPIINLEGISNENGKLTTEKRRVGKERISAERISVKI
jgi:hypothetical protein